MQNTRSHATLSATAVFSPSLIGDFRTGFARLYFRSFPYALGFDVTKLGFPKAFADDAQIRSFPAFAVAGLVGIGGSGSAGQSYGGMNSWGQRGSSSFKKATMSALELSRHTPTTSNSLNLDRRFVSSGMSDLHGPHQVAQY